MIKGYRRTSLLQQTYFGYYLWSILTLSIVISKSDLVYAQKPLKATQDKKLVELFKGIKNADGFTYRIKVQSSIAGDTQQTPAISSVNYCSQSAFIMYSQSEQELMLLSNKGQFKVDHHKKIVYYKVFDTDGALDSAKLLYLTQMGNVFDSFFLSSATITQKKMTKKNVFYHLTYPASSLIKEFKILARLSDGIPENVSYVLDRLANESAQPLMIRQRLTMDHYQHSMPDEVRLLLAESKDIVSFLQKKYAGYNLQKI